MARPKKIDEATTETAPQQQHVSIEAPNFRVAEVTIVGDAPYVQNKFSQKAIDIMLGGADTTKKKGGKRAPRDLKGDCDRRLHVSLEGWHGIPVPALQSAMVDACRTVAFKMTHAKQAVKVLGDGYDQDGVTPLVRITKGKPRVLQSHVILANGKPDVLWRPCFDPGWEARPRVQYDADMFKATDTINLLLRAGLQVGIGCGRPGSKKSTGQGWGTFRVTPESTPITEGAA